MPNAVLTVYDCDNSNGNGVCAKTLPSNAIWLSAFDWAGGRSARGAGGGGGQASAVNENEYMCVNMCVRMYLLWAISAKRLPA